MSYKSSIFNYIHPTDDNKLLLYNSYVGFDSLASISADDFEIINNSLGIKNIENNNKFQKLKKLGYFVESHTDEILLCEQKYMNIVEENTLRLIILPTEKCNFCCKYCYETFDKGKMSLEIQDSLIKFVKKNITKFSSMEVRWSGGEPLEALDVVENLSNAFIRILLKFKTNNNYRGIINMDIINRIVSILHEEGIEAEYTGGDLDLRDYIIDSIQFISFIVEVEREFDIEIPNEILLYDSISSLHSFADLIRRCKM